VNFVDPFGLYAEQPQQDPCFQSQSDISPCWALHNTVSPLPQSPSLQSANQSTRSWEQIHSLIRDCKAAGGLSLPQTLRRAYLWDYAEFLLFTLTITGRDQTIGHTDLEALALLADYASTFNISNTELSQDITYVIVGPCATGQHTITEGGVLCKPDGVGSTERRNKTGSPTFLERVWKEGIMA